MKNAFWGFTILLASAVAFAVGDVTAARSAANDISSALGQDAKTGLPYLRVYVVNPAGSQLPAGSVSSASQESRTMTLTEGSSSPIAGTLTSAAAIDRPCDLIVFENGQSRLILVSPSGTSLQNVHVAGTVSASGNPLGYSCSIVLKYATP